MSFGRSGGSQCTGGLSHHRPVGGNRESSCASRNKKAEPRTEKLWCKWLMSSLPMVPVSHVPVSRARKCRNGNSAFSKKTLPLKRWFQATDGSIAREPIRMPPESKWASRLWRRSRWEMPHGGVCKEHRGGFLLSRYSDEEESLIKMRIADSF